MKKRAKNLTDQRVKEIVNIIDVWDGAIRWAELIDEIRRETKETYTRQALAKKPSIAEAFALRRRAPLKKAAIPAKSPELTAALSRCERLERNLERVEVQNAALLEQFVRWAYNARIRGLTKEYLNQPLPDVDRDQTVLRPGRRSPQNDPAG